jgi:tRNA threonylcarbamoyladenosine modification (KEOPS) complex Cgi121 subunit
VGSSTYTIDDPELFDLIIGVTKGTKSVVYTLPDCWVTDFGLNFSQRDKEVREEHEVRMRNPSAVTLVETIA